MKTVHVDEIRISWTPFGEKIPPGLSKKEREVEEIQTAKALQGLNLS